MSPSSETSDNTASNRSEKNESEYLVYFIRHGEALHNVLEKQAKQEAVQEAIAEGLDANDDIVKLRMEEARKAILNNDSLQDCPLTPRGVEEACGAKATLEKLTTASEEEEINMPYPSQVLVSPLQRALQTADTIFPDHQSIHVREELRERQTLKACDTRQRSYALSKRPEFKRFSMNRLRLASLTRSQLPGLMLDELIDYDESTADESKQEAFGGSRSSSVVPSPIQEEEEEEDDDYEELDYDQVEEKHMLRVRTRKIFGLLRESEHRVICIVAHKGYLRELERGPLGQPQAKEFKNCEVRVYKLSLTDFSRTKTCSNPVEKVERLV